MDFQDVVDRWWSAQGFVDRPLFTSALNQVLKNARRFDQHILVLQSADDRADFWRAADPYSSFGRDGRPGVYHAPTVLVLCRQVVNEEATGNGKSRSADGAVAQTERHIEVQPSPWLTLVELTAVDAGLAFFTIALVNNAALARRFELPEDQVPESAIALGYASDEPVRHLEPLPEQPSEFIHYGRWSEHTAPNANT